MATADDVSVWSLAVSFRDGDVVCERNDPTRAEHVVKYVDFNGSRNPYVTCEDGLEGRGWTLLRRPMRVGDHVRHMDGTTFVVTERALVDAWAEPAMWTHADGTEIDLPKPTETKRIVKVGDVIRVSEGKIGVSTCTVTGIDQRGVFARNSPNSTTSIAFRFLGAYDIVEGGMTYQIDVEGTQEKARAIAGAQAIAKTVHERVGEMSSRGFIATATTKDLEAFAGAKLTSVVQDDGGGGPVVVGPRLSFAASAGERPCGGEILLARTIFKTDPAVIAIVTEKSDCKRTRPLGLSKRLMSDGRPVEYAYVIVDQDDHKAYDRAMQIAWERNEGGLATAAKKRAAEIVAELRKPTAVVKPGVTGTGADVYECMRRCPDFKLTTSLPYLRATWTHAGHPYELNYTSKRGQSADEARAYLASMCLANIRAVDDGDWRLTSAAVIAPSTTCEWVEY